MSVGRCRLGVAMEKLHPLSLQSRCNESDPVAADPSGNPHMSGVSFDPTWVRTLPAKLAGVPGAVAVLGLMGALTSPSHAQAPPLGTDGSFAILAGTPSISNTGPSVITGDLGISPGAAVIGFPPGIVVGGTIHAADAVALQAKNDLVTAYNNLAGRPTTADLTGQNLGGLTLIAGVYAFTRAALFSTGNKTLTLDGRGNPNSIFIFNIGSTLTTASASNVLLINGAQAGNVFWRVGSSATLGTTTTFKGDILALTDISLLTGATINCGAAWARNGQVTLDTNVISICTTTAASVSSVLLSSATDSQRGVANAIDAFVRNGGTLPPAFANLLSLLSPSQLADAFAQLQGEAGTGAAQAGTLAMNSFLSLVTSPFANNRGFGPESQLSPSPSPSLIYKAPFHKAPPEAAPDPRRWSIWAAGYGGQSNAAGDPLAGGSHDRSVRTFGYAV